MRRLVLLILQRGGHEVEAVCNGREGLERWGSRHFDLVVTDLDMPEMGGTEMIRSLSLDDEQRRFLVITGRPGTAPPGWPCLPKPFLPKELLQRVNSLLGLA